MGESSFEFQLTKAQDAAKALYLVQEKANPRRTEWFSVASNIYKLPDETAKLDELFDYVTMLLRNKDTYRELFNESKPTLEKPELHQNRFDELYRELELLHAFQERLTSMHHLLWALKFKLNELVDDFMWDWDANKKNLQETKDLAARVKLTQKEHLLAHSRYFEEPTEKRLSETLGRAEELMDSCEARRLYSSVPLEFTTLLESANALVERIRVHELMGEDRDD